MAGGKWDEQNKVRPAAYINFEDENGQELIPAGYATLEDLRKLDLKKQDKGDYPEKPYVDEADNVLSSRIQTLEDTEIEPFNLISADAMNGIKVGSDSKFYALSAENKVDKEVDKGLISNDELTKLGNIEDFAQVNKIEKFLMNGVELAIKDKSIDIELGVVLRMKGSVATYADLPTDAIAGDMYNVLDTGDNYAFTVDGTWDKLSGIVDLSDYLTREQTLTLLADKSDLSHNHDFSYQPIGDYANEVDVEQALESKVDKVEGKGLSSNDFTVENKAKLDSSEFNAQANKIEQIKVNGVLADVENKLASVNVDVSPASLISDETPNYLTVGDDGKLRVLSGGGGSVQSVNHSNPDSDGNVIIDIGVVSVNNKYPEIGDGYWDTIKEPTDVYYLSAPHGMLQFYSGNSSFGIYITKDYGSTWQQTSLTTGDFRHVIRGITTPFVTIRSTGDVYNSTDGIQWTKISTIPNVTGHIALFDNIGIGLLAFDVINSSTVIHKSIDGGVTWAVVATIGIEILTCYVNRFGQEGYILVGGRTSAGGAIYKNIMADDVWTEISENLLQVSFIEKFNPEQEMTLYAGIGTRFCSSVDNGATWQPVSTFNSEIISFIVDYRSNTFYVGDLNLNGTNGISYSTDLGKTWNKVEGVELPVMSFARGIKRGTQCIFAGGLGLYSSSSSGNVNIDTSGTVKSVNKSLPDTNGNIDLNVGVKSVNGNSTHYDFLDVLFRDIGGSNKKLHRVGTSLLAGSNKGISISDNHGETWELVLTETNDFIGFVNIELNRVFALFKTKCYVSTDLKNWNISHTLQNGGEFTTIFGVDTSVFLSELVADTEQFIYMTNDTAITWNTITLLSGIRLSGVIYFGGFIGYGWSGTQGKLATSTDFGVTWTITSSPRMFRNMIVADSSFMNSRMLATAGNSIYESKDFGVSWTEIHSFGSSYVYDISVFAIHPDNKNILYAIQEPYGFFWYSNDGGFNWKLLNNYPPNGTFSFAWDIKNNEYQLLIADSWIYKAVSNGNVDITTLKDLSLTGTTKATTIKADVINKLSPDPVNMDLLNTPFTCPSAGMVYLYYGFLLNKCYAGIFINGVNYFRHYLGANVGGYCSFAFPVNKGDVIIREPAIAPDISANIVSQIFFPII